MNEWSGWHRWEVQRPQRKPDVFRWFGEACFIRMRSLGFSWPAPFFCSYISLCSSSAPVGFPSLSLRAKTFLLVCGDLHTLAALGDLGKAANSSDKLYLKAFPNFRLCLKSEKSCGDLGLVDKIPEILGTDICFLLSNFQWKLQTWLSEVHIQSLKS